MDIENIQNLIKNLEQKVNNLESKVNRQDKMIKKLKKELNPETEKKVRKPSGFATPTYISPELCKFLNEPVGTEIARTEVTKRITDYIKQNDLQNKESKKNIDIDDKLQELLSPTEAVTYFNIQKLLKKHYVKPETTTTTTTTEENVPAPNVKSSGRRKTKV